MNPRLRFNGAMLGNRTLGKTERKKNFIFFNSVLSLAFYLVYTCWIFFSFSLLLLYSQPTLAHNAKLIRNHFIVLRYIAKCLPSTRTQSRKIKQTVEHDCSLRTSAGCECVYLYIYEGYLIASNLGKIQIGTHVLTTSGPKCVYI
jgi:hypothetical protein